MWYRKIVTAERGQLNIPFAKSEFGKLLNQSLKWNGSDSVSIDFDVLNRLVTGHFPLRMYISKVVQNTTLPKAEGYFNSLTGELGLNQIKSPIEIPAIIGTFAHEIVHALDPALKRKLQAKSLIYPYKIDISLSFEDNVKINAIYDTAATVSYPDEIIRQKTLSGIYGLEPKDLLKHFDSWNQYYPNEMAQNMDEGEILGIVINGQRYKKENYEKYQAQNLPKRGQISAVKYFDDHIEPVAWRNQIDADFSPNNLLRWYSESKKVNKTVTPEKFIEFAKSLLFFPDEKKGTFGGINQLYNHVGGIGHNSDHFFKNIKDEKIKRQILEHIGKNIAKADLLLKGGLLRLSMLDLMALNPEYAKFIKEEYLNDLTPEYRSKFYVTQDINGNFKGFFEGLTVPENSYVDETGYVFAGKPFGSKKRPTIKLPRLNHQLKVPMFTIPEQPVKTAYCQNAGCDEYNKMKSQSGDYCAECGEKMIVQTKTGTTPETPKQQTDTTQKTPQQQTDAAARKAPEQQTTTTPKQQTTTTQRSLSSDQIVKKTSSLPDVKKPSTPKSTSALSQILPTIKKLFTELGAILDKFNNTRAGRVFNYGMLAKDVYFVITLTNQISKQIENKEEIMMKDQLDLGLTIVSIITDQQTQAILKTLYPPIIALLENPQVKAWLIGLNIGANVLMGLVSVTDWIGSNIDNVTGEANPNTGTMSGIQNVPGSAQALVMPVFQLFDKYGEVFNALVDVEKGMAVPQAINKHIMKDYSGGIEPYRSSLFYKFRQNKDKILAYQKSPAFKKLPVENQVLYPNANSPYAISSYKKARDARERERQEAMARYRASRMPKE